MRTSTILSSVLSLISITTTSAAPTVSTIARTPCTGGCQTVALLAYDFSLAAPDSTANTLIIELNTAVPCQLKDGSDCNLAGIKIDPYFTENDNILCGAYAGDAGSKYLGNFTMAHPILLGHCGNTQNVSIISCQKTEKVYPPQSATELTNQVGGVGAC